MMKEWLMRFQRQLKRLGLPTGTCEKKDADSK